MLAVLLAACGSKPQPIGVPTADGPASVLPMPASQGTGNADRLRPGAQLAGGGYSACAIIEKKVWCWGSSAYGFGDGTKQGAVGYAPRQITAITEPVASISGESSHYCAVTVSGKLWCWGDNGFSQTGLPRLTAGQIVLTATRIDFPVPIARVVAGMWTTCAVTVKGEVYCWGDNSGNVLGVSGYMAGTPLPIRIVGLPEVVDISAHTDVACAAGVDGAVYCWGSNTHGEMGQPASVESSLTPLKVPGITDATQVSVALSDVCAATASGAAWCWGRTALGQLGNGAPVDIKDDKQFTATPVHPSPLPGDVVEVQQAYTRACALTKSAQIYCWGDRAVGLKYSNERITNRPEKITLPIKPVEMVVGGSFVCARDAGWQVYCWGINDSSEITPSPTRFPVGPTKIQGLP